MACLVRSRAASSGADHSLQVIVSDSPPQFSHFSHSGDLGWNSDCAVSAVPICVATRSVRHDDVSRQKPSAVAVLTWGRRPSETVVASGRHPSIGSSPNSPTRGRRLTFHLCSVRHFRFSPTDPFRRYHVKECRRSHFTQPKHADTC